MGDTIVDLGLKRTRATFRAPVQLISDLDGAGRYLRIANLEFPIPAEPGVGRLVRQLSEGMRLDRLQVQLASAGHRRAWRADVLKGMLLRGLLQFDLHCARGQTIRILPNRGGFLPAFREPGAGSKVRLSPNAFFRRRSRSWTLQVPGSDCDLTLVSPSTLIVIGKIEEGLPYAELSTNEQLIASLLLGLGMATDSSEEGANRDRLEFHEVLFHYYSRRGNHGLVAGSVYGDLPTRAVPPAVGRYPGVSIPLPPAELEPKRYAGSVRRFAATPVPLDSLSRLLSRTVRASDRRQVAIAPGRDVEYVSKPYPSGGGLYELEVYLAAVAVEGLEFGFYHYESESHALTKVSDDEHKIRRLVTICRTSMGVESSPPVVLVFSARFGRMTWKYKAITYAIILKNVGVLMRTIYDVLPGLGLGGCALGSGNVQLFSELTGLASTEESSVGEFAFGIPEME